MSENVGSAHVVRLDEIDPIPVAGGLYLPLRRLLGVRSFGINAYSARNPGDQLIEEHDETGIGSGHQEEAYIVVSGHARFTLGSEQIEARTGTIVFVPELATTRAAVAVAPDTTVVVVGGPADRPLRPSPFEYWFVAEVPYRRGDYQAAIEIAAQGLQDWPDHPALHYQLACYHALGGNTSDAFNHLERATAGDSRAREWAAQDTDLDTLRDDPRFAALTE